MISCLFCDNITLHLDWVLFSPGNSRQINSPLLQPAASSCYVNFLYYAENRGGEILIQFEPQIELQIFKKIVSFL